MVLDFIELLLLLQTIFTVLYHGELRGGEGSKRVGMGRGQWSFIGGM